MKKLPLGIQTFSSIIEGKYLYIDKTKEIFTLITQDIYYFLSRPRRFGKSLLVSTLGEIFRGNQTLFKGLYIYNKISWKKYPVIQLDFSIIPHSSPKILQKALCNILDDYSEYYGIKLEKEFLEERFLELIRKLAENEKIVILIDEYDKPILDHIANMEKARANREVLRSFYAVLKGADPYLHFVFLTGVTKFNKVSIFSGLNNILDITLDRRFTTLLGITQEEFLAYFPEYIDRLALEESIGKEDLIEEIKTWYNGYSWDGVNFLYNPTSILSLFTQYIFNNYWFATGTPSFLMNLIKEKQITAPEIEPRMITHFGLDNADIENLELYSLLFQTGYLTITGKEKIGRMVQYSLGFPNLEVRESFYNHLFAIFTTFEALEIPPLYMNLIKHLQNRDMEKFQTGLTYLFSRIPYTLHLPYESYYHSLFYIILALMGAKIDMEVLSDKGRIDAVLELEKLIYIIEFKMGKAEEALKQIKEKRYWEPYLGKGKVLYLLGAGGFGEKQIEVLAEKVE